MKIGKIFLALILPLALIHFSVQFSFAKAKSLVSVKAETAPKLDGDGSDDVWEKVEEVVVEAEDGPEIAIKSVYTKDKIFFLLSWEDLSESINMGQWVYDGKKWNIKQEEGIDDDVDAHTDRLAFQWPINDAASIKKKIKGKETTFVEKGCTVLCHAPEKEDKMYTSASGQMTDLWMWLSALTNPLKYADDMYQDHTNVLTTQEKDRVKRVTAAQKGDDLGAGGVTFQPNNAGNGPKWMPKGGPNKTFFVKGEEVPLDMSKIKKGDTIPGWLLARPKGSRGNISAMGKYDEDEALWVVELSRELVTGDKAHDAQFDDLKKTYYFGLATWDNDRLQAHTRVKSPFALTFK